MTPLQILGFQKMQGISSHLDGVFDAFVTFERQIDIIFDNYAPLSPRVLGKPTFLQ
jgi:hypothetical protein